MARRSETFRCDDGKIERGKRTSETERNETKGGHLIETREDLRIEVEKTIMETKGNLIIEMKGNLIIEMKGEPNIEMKGEPNIEMKGDLIIELTDVMTSGTRENLMIRESTEITIIEMIEQGGESMTMEARKTNVWKKKRKRTWSADCAILRRPMN
jgi:hypothetical protein